MKRTDRRLDILHAAFTNYGGLILRVGDWYALKENDPGGPRESAVALFTLFAYMNALSAISIVELIAVGHPQTVHYLSGHKPLLVALALAIYAAHRLIARSGRRANGSGTSRSKGFPASAKIYLIGSIVLYALVLVVITWPRFGGRA